MKRTEQHVRSGLGRLDPARLANATEDQIDEWKRQDDIDDARLGPSHFVSVPDLTRLRRRLGLSQEAFARKFQLSLRTVQDWEQGRRAPDGPARLLLRVIERDPEAVSRALASPPDTSG